MSFNFKNYLRSIWSSFVIIFMIAYGMATQNVWLQWGGIVIVFVIQLGWQTYKGMKSGPAMEENLKEASRARRSRALIYMSAQDVQAARSSAGSSGQRSESLKTITTLLIPLMVFFGTNYLIHLLWPSTPAWQTYVTAGLLSIPASAIVSAKSGFQAGMASQVMPTSYLITERGIVFEPGGIGPAGRSFILKFPLIRAEEGKGANTVEVEGKKENDLIPHRLKLCTDKVDELLRVLTPRVKAD